MKFICARCKKRKECVCSCHSLKKIGWSENSIKKHRCCVKAHGNKQKGPSIPVGGLKSFFASFGGFNDITRLPVNKLQWYYLLK